jgi:hypothetical protein
MFDCTQLDYDGINKVENDGLEGKNLFVFMYESNSGDLVLDGEPTEHSYIKPRMSGVTSRASKEAHDR